LAKKPHKTLIFFHFEEKNLPVGKVLPPKKTLMTYTSYSTCTRRYMVAKELDQLRIYFLCTWNWPRWEVFWVMIYHYPRNKYYGKPKGMEKDID
jgi:hypothetical protein